jgi:hypothetical protein
MSTADLTAQATEYANQAFSLATEYGAKFDTQFEDAVGPVHPLSANLPLMSPSGFFGATFVYLVIVLTVPILFSLIGFSMKMKPVMRLYNLGMVLLSGYMCAKSIMLASASNSSVFCVPLAKGPAGVEMANLVWIFTFSKLLEFFDTFFMIMEGRTRQIRYAQNAWFTMVWVLLIVQSTSLFLTVLVLHFRFMFVLFANRPPRCDTVYCTAIIT